jgi:hypothetical protein
MLYYIILFKPYYHRMRAPVSRSRCACSINPHLLAHTACVHGRSRSVVPLDTHLNLHIHGHIYLYPTSIVVYAVMSRDIHLLLRIWTPPLSRYLFTDTSVVHSAPI